MSKNIAYAMPTLSESITTSQRPSLCSERNRNISVSNKCINLSAILTLYSTQKQPASSIVAEKMVATDDGVKMKIGGKSPNDKSDEIQSI